MSSTRIMTDEASGGNLLMLSILRHVRFAWRNRKFHSLHVSLKAKRRFIAADDPDSEAQHSFSREIWNVCQQLFSEFSLTTYSDEHSETFFGIISCRDRSEVSSFIPSR